MCGNRCQLRIWAPLPSRNALPAGSVKLPSGQLDTVSVDRLKPSVFPVTAEDEPTLDNAAQCEETAEGTELPPHVAINDLASQPLPVYKVRHIQARHVRFTPKSNVVLF